MDAEVHNIMEELVKEKVEKLFDEAEQKKLPWLSCSCRQCRSDTLCYVLNRIPPKYIRSGRGISHHISDEISEKSQIQADISALVMEGMKKISETQRPHLETPENDEKKDSPVFNFPTITGRILNGLSFEPEKNIQVALYLNGKLCSPINTSWENPCKINEKTPGNFVFWVKPEPAEKAGEKKVFSFEIKINAEGKEPALHHFEVGLTSESLPRNAYNPEKSVKLPDFFLFPVNDAYDSMQ